MLTLFFSSLGYSFHIATQLSGNIDSFFDRIEDAIVQADEVDGKYLQVNILENEPFGISKGNVSKMYSLVKNQFDLTVVAV